MKNILSAIFAISLLIHLGCGSDSDSKKGKGSGDSGINKKLGYNPSQRWPDSGNYSYDFSTNINGVKCQTTQSFKSEAGYCLGLQDAQLNKSCALDQRKNSYQYDCGNDFQQINIPSGFLVSGFDSKIQTQCQTAQATQSLFEVTQDFCDFLKDESQHKNCFWDKRFDKFEELGCQGEFSQEPTAVADNSGYDPRLGYNPKQRWPSENNFNYHFFEYRDVLICETTQSFSSQAEYCVGLQNSKLNKNCALNERKSSYLKDCGIDFQEIR